jgi:HK97 gp10 family phage protein
MFKSTLDGDLAARLQALPGAMTTPILVKALKAGAEPIRSRMAALAPRSSPDSGKPGHLADNIVVSATRKVEGRSLGEGEAAVAIGPTGDYNVVGRVNEFGRHDGTMPAHPFARPGFDGGQDAALRIVVEELWNALRASAEKGFGASFTSGSTGGRGQL